MDITRPPEVAQQRKRRRLIAGVAVALVLIAATVALARLKRAAPSVDASPLWIDTVKRGTMLRNVRGVGVLIPDDIRWITALTDGRVERVLVQPGTPVTADTVLLELSNPQTEQAALNADLDLKGALVQYEILKVDLEKDLLAQRSATASVAADAAQAAMDAEANDAMAKQGLISAIVAKQSRLRAETTASRKKLEDERLANSEKSLAARLAVQQGEIDRRRTVATLRRNEALGLKVRAGMAGVLQQVPVEAGQRISPGTNLARVADPGRLRAQIQVAETQVKDVTAGLKAEVDTRTGIVHGHVVRIDPAAKNGTVTVDVVFDEPLPRGARPDMSVDGTIQLERLDDVLYVGRPAFGQEQSKASLFKLSEDGSTATLTVVELGRTSVNAIEVVRGLTAGDRVVLSDMSAWDGYERIRLR
jgi:HlyD family secretion protein